VFVANIADEFILGLDVMHALNASVDLTSHMLGLGNEELPLQRPAHDSTEHLM
jgi:hypothetical protein